MPKVTLRAIRITVLVLSYLPAIVAAQEPKKCSSPAAEYANRGYKVKEIQVDTPLRAFGQVKSKITEIKTTLAQPGKYLNDQAKAHPLKEKELFNTASWSEGAKIVRQSFDGDLATVGRVRVTLVLPHLRACEEKDTSLGNPQGEPTLIVEYKVYTTDYLSYLSSIYEGEGKGLSRAVLPTSLTRFLTANSPQPYIEFNRSRALFGGAKLVSKTDNPLSGQISTEAAGSSSSAQAGLSFQGSKNSDSKALSHVEWIGGYKYSNIPGAPMALKEGEGFGQLIAASQPLGKLKIVLRFGGSVEGGNQQTDLSPSLVPPGILTSTGYSSLKLFAGGTFRKAFLKVTHDFTASYGIEIGRTGSGRDLDYIKNLFDLGYSARFLPWVHRPIAVDTRFTVGNLDTRGPTPLGARFFGGNAEKNFLSSDDWTIRSNPFIRSFAENQFIPAGERASIGGDHFYSLNLTFAPTVWGRPLVPRDLVRNPDFATNVEFSFNTVENTTMASYLADSGPVTAFANSLLQLDEATAGQVSPLNIIKDNLLLLRSQLAADPDALATLADIKSSVDDTQSKLADLKSEVAKKGQVLLELQTVGKDFTNCTDFSEITAEVIPSALHDLASSLTDLMQLLDDKGVPVSDARRQKLEVQKALVDSLYRVAPCEYSLLVSANVDCSCKGNIDQQTKQALANAHANALRQAKETIAPAREIFGRLTKELNLIGVSPLVIFDAARIRSRISASTTSTTRYGVGGGVRFSIVSLDVDLGYAFNKGRQAPERHGAFVFSLRINDLLR